MVLVGVYDDSVISYKEKGFYNRSANAITIKELFTVFVRLKKHFLLKNLKNLYMYHEIQVLILMNICKFIDNQ